MEFVKTYAKKLLAGEGTKIEYSIVTAVVVLIVFMIL